MQKFKFNYFLDYGTCLWCANDDFTKQAFKSFIVENLPLSDETKAKVESFLQKYFGYYGDYCPPLDNWSSEDCRKFNEANREVLELLCAELVGVCFICVKQLDLMEDPKLLDEYYENPHEFLRQKRLELYGKRNW